MAIRFVFRFVGSRFATFVPTLGIALTLGMARQAYSEDWNQFRGPNGSGIAQKLSLPDELTDETIRWKHAVLPGNSSPVIVGGKMFLSSFSEDNRNLHCFRAEDGQPLWTCSVPAVRSETATPPNGPATSSVACDGKRVVAFFPDTGLLVCSMEGEQLYLQDIGPFSSMHGLSSSPILHDDTIVLTVDQLTEPYIAALDAASGDLKWKTDRLLGVTGGYSTPSLLNLDGNVYVLSAAPGELAVYDFQSGEKVTSVQGLANAPVSTPVVVGSRAYYSEPPGEPLPMAALGGADKNQDGVIELSEVAGSIAATRLIQRIDSGFGDNNGAVDQAEWDRAFGTFLNRGGFSCVNFLVEDGKLRGELSWQYSKATPYIPSALVVDDVAYLINDGGILMAFDSGSGELLQRTRLSGATGQYYASPVGGQGKIALANLQGEITLVRTGRTHEVLATYSVGEPIIATPSINNGRLIVRTKSHLICFGEG